MTLSSMGLATMAWSQDDEELIIIEEDDEIILIEEDDEGASKTETTENHTMADSIEEHLYFVRKSDKTFLLFRIYGTVWAHSLLWN